MSLGVETGSQRMLDAINKGVTVAQVRAGLAALRRAGIRVLAYIMFGLPGETDDTVRETMDLVRDHRPDFALFAGLMPDPLSELCGREQAAGRYTQEDVFSLYYTGSSKGTPFDRITFTGFPRTTVERWVRDAYRSYYLRPGYMARRLLSVKNPHEVGNLARGAFALLRDAVAYPGYEDIVPE